MKQVTNTCDLCRQEKARVHLKSFYFDSSKIPQSYILTDNLLLSDTHICELCINVIKTHSEEQIEI